MKSERVKLTPARAMLLYMLCYLVSESEFAAEKLAIFCKNWELRIVLNYSLDSIIMVLIPVR